MEMYLGYLQHVVRVPTPATQAFSQLQYSLPSNLSILRAMQTGEKIIIKRQILLLIVTRMYYGTKSSVPL